MEESPQSLTMEKIESTTQKRAGIFASAWGWLKDLPCRLKAEVTKVAKSIKKLGQDDPRRITHSLKVGLALTLVSLLYYSRPLYDSFGVSGMWAVLTVVVIFEFSVGATLSKSLNRGFATLLAGALGFGAERLASLCGEKGEPIVLGILVFLLAAASTFTRFFPRIKARYDYGVLIFILTFSLVAVSGYRVEELLVLAHQRLSTILIGGATCILISIFVCPVWAGEELHKLIASNVDKLGNTFEGLGAEIFQEMTKDEKGGDMISNKNKSFLQEYKSILNSKTSEETFANFARWEPGHGRFRLRHPWQQYLKIGALARQCAYQIEALNGHIDCNIQVPEEFQSAIQESCKKMILESGKALKALASSIKTMTDPSPATNPHIETSRNAVEDLQTALKEVSLNSLDLHEIVPAATVASTLVEIVKWIEKISDSVTELSILAHFKKVASTVSPEGKTTSHLLHRGTVSPVLDGDSNHVVITIKEESDSPKIDNPNDKAPNPGQVRVPV